MTAHHIQREPAHVGEVGRVVIPPPVLTLRGASIDITGAVVAQVLVRLPSGDEATWTASVHDGPKGLLSYSTQAGDIIEAGLYRVQAYVELPGGEELYGREGTLRVHSAIEGADDMLPSTSGRIDLYVDAAEGKDTNHGRSKDAPLATLIEAERRIPDIVAHPVVIHVAPHVGDGYAPPTFRERIMRASIDVAADSGGDRDDGLRELVPETACLEGSNHVTIKTPPGLGVDTLRGKTVEIMSGLAKGCRRTIRNNTDDSIVLAWCLPAQIEPLFQPGDTFRIVEPVTLISPPPEDGYTSNAFTMGANSAHQYYERKADHRAAVPGLNLVNFMFDWLQEFEAGQEVRFFGCEILSNPSLLTYFRGPGGSFASGIDSYDPERVYHPDQPDSWYYHGRKKEDSEWAMVGERVAGVHPMCWAGWGLTAQKAIAFAGCSTYMGALVAPGVGFMDSARAVMAGGNVWREGVLVLEARVELHGKLYLPDVPALFHSDSGYAVRASRGSWVRIEEATLSAPNGVCVLSESGSIVHIGHAGIRTLTGETAVKAHQGGRVQWQAAPTISASSNQIEVGNTPTVGTVADDLSAVGDYIAEPDGSIVQRIS